MVLQPIFEVCERYQGYGGGGGGGVPWWSQEAPEVTIMETLEEEISREAREKWDRRYKQ